MFALFYLEPNIDLIVTMIDDGLPTPSSREQQLLEERIVREFYSDAAADLLQQGLDDLHLQRDEHIDYLLSGRKKNMCTISGSAHSTRRPVLTPLWLCCARRLQAMDLLLDPPLPRPPRPPAACHRHPPPRHRCRFPCCLPASRRCGCLLPTLRDTPRIPQAGLGAAPSSSLTSPPRMQQSRPSSPWAPPTRWDPSTAQHCRRFCTAGACHQSKEAA